MKIKASYLKITVLVFVGLTSCLATENNESDDPLTRALPFFNKPKPRNGEITPKEAQEQLVQRESPPESGKPQQASLSTPLQRACRRDQEERLWELLGDDKQFDEGIKGYLVKKFFQHAEQGEEAWVRRYLKEFNFIDEKDTYGNTAMHIVASTGNDVIMALLLEYDADVMVRNDEELMPIEVARIRGHKKVELTVSAHLLPRLHQAAQEGDIATVAEICNCGIDVNATTQRGRTLLHHALKQRNNVDLVIFLLASQNIDVRCADDQGNTPLHYAVEYEEYKVIMPLIKLGGCIDAYNVRRQTPAFIAYQKSEIKIMEEFRKAGVKNNKYVDLFYSDYLSKAIVAYDMNKISERHRHRFEFNND